MAKAEETKVSVSKNTKGKLPSLPFVRIKDAILGKDYDLSIAFVGPSVSARLNATYRKKNKPTNVLSFPITKKSGEIILCESVMRREAPKFKMSYRRFTGFLLIHGMLHLKGLLHGSTMDNEEKKFLAKFSKDF